MERAGSGGRRRRAGVPWIALWRHKVQETGLKESARLVRDAGLKVSSLCRGGMFPAATAAERQERLDDNRRAIEEAAELGTDVLVLVCGPAPDKISCPPARWSRKASRKSRLTPNNAG